MPTTTDYLTQLQTDKQTLVTNLVAKGVSASSSDTFTTLAPKVLEISGGMDWQDTITDDWDTIIANANAGTVSGYSIGDTKTLEFLYNGMPIVLQFMIIDKSHETISGTTTKAALTFMTKYRQLWNRYSESNSNTGGYMGATGDLYSVSLDETDGALDNGCLLRKNLWTIYKAFPSNLQTAIKTVDKSYDDADDSIRTAKEKFFLRNFD